MKSPGPSAARGLGLRAAKRNGGHQKSRRAALRWSLVDAQVLELATAQQRILITRNSRDFAPLARQWAEAQRSHAGLILIWTLDHSQFAEVAVRTIQQTTKPLPLTLIRNDG
jgi:hypothetical protein